MSEEEILILKEMGAITMILISDSALPRLKSLKFVEAQQLYESSHVDGRVVSLQHGRGAAADLPLSGPGKSPPCETGLWSGV